MKKKDTNAGKHSVLEARAKRREEDRIFNKMLVWLAAAAVAEIFFVIVNHVYVNPPANGLNGMILWHTILLILLVVGIAAFAVCLFLGRRQRAAGRDTVLPYAVGTACLVAGVGGFILRTYGSGAVPLVLTVAPGLAILAVVFYLYQKEFFPCVLIGGLAILSLLVFRGTDGLGPYPVCLAVTLVAAAVGLGLCLKLRKTDGKLTVRGKPVQIFQPNAAYIAYFLTVVIVVVMLLCPLALGSAMAYYGIWAIAAWLFILAVYFTSRLM